LVFRLSAAADHRVIEELDGNGNVTASYVYGQYIDEVLQMRRDTDPGAVGMEDHYYLHDDLFNVLGLADAAGNVVERYAYDDYGAPTIYNGDGTATRAESAFQNAFLFNGWQPAKPQVATCRARCLTHFGAPWSAPVTFHCSRPPISASYRAGCSPSEPEKVCSKRMGLKISLLLTLYIATFTARWA